jgi:hypothetical protein
VDNATAYRTSSDGLLFGAENQRETDWDRKDQEPEQLKIKK